MRVARGAGQQDESSRTDLGESGRSRAKRLVVSSPALPLITRKFAGQSHSAARSSQNDAFHRLTGAVRVGSIPIARSTLSLPQTTRDNSRKPKSVNAWEDLGIQRRFRASLVVLGFSGTNLAWPGHGVARNSLARVSAGRSPSLSLASATSRW